MDNRRRIPTYNGKTVGFLVIIAALLLVGISHFTFGIWLLFPSGSVMFFGDVQNFSTYASAYTIIYSSLTLLFTVGLWMTKRWGWVGTMAVGLVVIVADLLVMLDLPSIPGIPRNIPGISNFGVIEEIGYYVVILGYLLQSSVRRSFGIR